jgi:hypothetical protein
VDNILSRPQLPSCPHAAHRPPQVLANASILYFITDLRRGLDHFLIFAALMCLLCFAGISLGMLVSSIIKNVEMAPRVA